MRDFGLASLIGVLVVGCSAGSEVLMGPDGQAGTEVRGSDTWDVIFEESYTDAEMLPENPWDLGGPLGDSVPKICESDEECNDGRPCTIDWCEPEFGCISVPKDCSDGNECTNDSCRAADGQCLHEVISCADDNLCTVESCDPQLGCISSKLDCDDNDPCTSDGCSPTQGCVHQPLTCDDGNPCTIDSCQPASGCTHVPSPDPNCCVADFQCDDSAPCTQDECVANSCKFTPIPGLTCCQEDIDCEDGNECTQNLCIEGLCQVFPAGAGCCEVDADCEDGDGCTVDSCQNWFCVYEMMEGCCHEDEECNDKEVCTQDVCLLTAEGFGFCENKEIPGCCHGSDVECDDGNVCTLDHCPGIGKVCTHEWVEGCCTESSQCDDGEPCTMDSCVENKCSHLDVCCYSHDECDDDNECTFDQCVDNFCQNLPTGAPGCCIPPIFEDDFSKDLGWDFGPNWSRSVAQASSGQQYGGPDPAEDHTDSPDNMLAGVVVGGNAPTSALHDFYWLTSPVINLTAAPSTNILLTFWRWLNSDYEPYMTNAIEVFDGSEWVTVWKTGESPGVQDSSWTYQEIDVTAQANSQFRVRFGYKINNLGVFQVSSWNIDDVKVRFSTGPLCCHYDSDCKTKSNPAAVCQNGTCYLESSFE